MTVKNPGTYLISEERLAFETGMVLEKIEEALLLKARALKDQGMGIEDPFSGSIILTSGFLQDTLFNQAFKEFQESGFEFFSPMTFTEAFFNRELLRLRKILGFRGFSSVYFEMDILTMMELTLDPSIGSMVWVSVEQTGKYFEIKWILVVKDPQKNGPVTVVPLSEWKYYRNKNSNVRYINIKNLKKQKYLFINKKILNIIQKHRAEDCEKSLILFECLEDRVVLYQM